MIRYSHISIILKWFLFCVIYGAAYGQAPLESNREPMLQDQKLINKRSLKLFDRVDINHKDLIVALQYICPRPLGDFTTFGQKRFTAYFDPLVDQFFNKKFKPRSRSLKPSKYFLAQDARDSDLLLYEWQVDDYSLWMMVSGNGALIRVKMRETKVGEQISSDELRSIITNVFLLNCKPDDHCDDRVATEEFYLEGFKFKQYLKNGDVFSNVPEDGSVTDSAPWQSHIVGVVVKDGIVILCLKTYSHRMRPHFLYKPRWLSDCLLEADGETLVATGKTEPNIQSQKLKAAKEKEAVRIPRNSKQLVEKLIRLDQVDRSKLLSALWVASYEGRLPESFRDALQEYYANESDLECRYKIILLQEDHPNPNKAIKFLETAANISVDSKERSLIQDEIDSIKEHK